MALNPFTWVNRRGSAAIQSTGVTVGTADVRFSFQNHAFLSNWYRGTSRLAFRRAQVEAFVRLHTHYSNPNPFQFLWLPQVDVTAEPTA